MPERPDFTAPAARGGVTVLCFLAIILGQVYLLRHALFSAPADLLTAPYLLELGFCLLMAVGIVICWRKPMGWTTMPGCICALALFAAYTVVSVINYPVFSVAYLSGIQATYASAGGALVALKLVLALVGVTAAIPVAASIPGREYAQRMREKVEKQNAQWATASVKGAKADLDATVARLKETLSKEELDALLTQLSQSAAHPAETADSASEIAADGATPSLPKDPGETSVTESWRGWGCG